MNVTSRWFAEIHEAANRNKMNSLKTTNEMRKEAEYLALLTRIAVSLEKQNIHLENIEKQLMSQNEILEEQNGYHAARNKTLSERSLPPLGERT